MRRKVICRDLVPVFDKFFNDFQVPWTRDRKIRAGRERGVPPGYVVQQVVQLQDSARWAVYQQQRDKVVTMLHSLRNPVEKISVKTSGLEQQLLGGHEALVESCNERYLFHGSPHAEAIADNHFELTRASKESLLGGDKVYLAELAGKADEYAGVADSGLKMLLCRVILGHSWYTEAPTLGEDDKSFLDELLQSQVVHSAHTYRKSTTQLHEFAVADARFLYPEYMIIYDRKP